MRPDSATLLRRFAAWGDEAAFAEFVRGHLDGVYAAALRRVGGDAHLAEDVAQQVFTAAARQAGRLAGHAAPTAWLYATTRNLAANVVRSEQRRKTREQEAVAMDETRDDSVEWNRLAPVLDGAIDELGERDRRIVLLRFIERQGFATIGAALGVSEDAARMRLERALEKLRVRLERRGVTSTAAALGLALGAHAAPVAPAGLAATVAGGALAGSATGGGTLAGILSLMAHSKWTATTAGVLALVTTGIATREAAAQRDAEAAWQAVGSEHERLIARMQELEQRASESERAADAAEAKARAAAAAKVTVAASSHAAPATEPGAAESRKAVIAADLMMKRHPGIRQALIEWNSAKARFDYGPLIRSLGLSPEAAEEFVSLVRGENLFGDFGVNGQFVEFRVPVELEGKAKLERLRELLGPAGYREYSMYGRTAAARGYAAQLASQLSLTDAPLTPAQADRFIATLLERRRNGNGDDRGGWNAVLADSGEHLLPAQLAVLKAIVDGERKSDAALAERLEAAKRMEKTVP